VPRGALAPQARQARSRACRKQMAISFRHSDTQLVSNQLHCSLLLFEDAPLPFERAFTRRVRTHPFRQPEPRTPQSKKAAWGNPGGSSSHLLRTKNRPSRSPPGEQRTYRCRHECQSATQLQ